MPDYRRFRVPGGTYFFTINLLERKSDLLSCHIDALRDAVRRTRRQRPFRIDAWVVLPDHMHCVITLTQSDDDFSNRIKAISIRFARAIPPSEVLSNPDSGISSEFRPARAPTRDPMCRSVQAALGVISLLTRSAFWISAMRRS